MGGDAGPVDVETRGLVVCMVVVLFFVFVKITKAIHIIATVATPQT